MRRTANRARLTAFFGSIFVLVSGSALADSRVVVELFTSQGCSSCPPADKLLGELAKDPGLLPISLSVDYWDYLGWKDTLALPSHSKRQRAYAGLRGDGAVYTPQVVINGVTHVLGSDKAAIESAVKRARSGDSVPVSVNVAITDGKVNVQVADATKAGQRGEVWLCPIMKQVPVQIGRGENRGNKVIYTNVVRGWIKLGDWSGEAKSFSRPLQDIAAEGKADAVAILVQDVQADGPGRVHGASTATLPHTR